MDQSFNRGDSNIHSSNITSSFNNIIDLSRPYEKPEILAWLSPLEPQIRHQELRSSRVNKVGDWLLQAQEYQNWLGGSGEGDSDGSVLFCYGDPGVGKTYIRQERRYSRKERHR